MESFSTPTDDNRMGYGIVLANGDCQSIVNLANAAGGDEECLVMGEGIDPSLTKEHDYRDPAFFEGADGGVLATGYDSVADMALPRSIEFEQQFCAALSGSPLNEWCEAEAETYDCQGEDRCFCGDITDTPKGGSK